MSSPPATPSANPTNPNPFHLLPYELGVESLGDDYFDIVSAADFPRYHLRWRNDRLLPLLGLNPEQVSDRHFTQAFGHFDGPQTPLALRYHGYQFGEYNPRLGDGRGFLYGQVRACDGALYDFGTKGSGRTPYSRGGDGRLTLKGGIREVLAAETLHALGVRTSRGFCLVETGEALWREDEPSPTRASVLIRFSRSHIRFGTFERLHHIDRPDLARKLLDWVIAEYYPDIDPKLALPAEERYSQFYLALVERTAELVAQWAIAGFCHGVLNTDNMSITGESFDYGPYGFIETYDPKFIAAYFDYWGRYSFGNQPTICRLNLEILQRSLTSIIPPGDMEVALAQFDSFFRIHYRRLMLAKLGCEHLPLVEATELVRATVHLLEASSIRYHHFFQLLRQNITPQWWNAAQNVLPAGLSSPPADTDSSTLSENNVAEQQALEQWRHLYYCALQGLPSERREHMAAHLAATNPDITLQRSQIETVWQAIAEADNWTPLTDLLQRIQQFR